LGFAFLWEFEPQPNWHAGRLKEGGVTLQSAKFKFLKEYVARAMQALQEG
jgi:hypothetical protein